MGKLRATESFGLGGTKTTETVFSGNHFSSKTKLSSEVRQKLASMGLERVAGNIWESPSTQDFWQVKGNKIVRLSGDEVDNGESITAAPSNQPLGFLSAMLDDLTF